MRVDRPAIIEGIAADIDTLTDLLQVMLDKIPGVFRL